MIRPRLILLVSALIVGAAYATEYCEVVTGTGEKERYKCHYGCCSSSNYPCCDKKKYETNLLAYVILTAALVVPFVITVAVCLIIRKRRQTAMLQRRTQPPIQFHLQQQVYQTPSSNLGPLPPGPLPPGYGQPMVLPTYSQAVDDDEMPRGPPPGYTPSENKPPNSQSQAPAGSQKTMPSL